MTKRCSVCLEEKPLAEFYFSTASREGRQSRCKPCSNKGVIDWKKKNPERLAENIKKYNTSETMKRKRDEIKGMHPERTKAYAAVVKAIRNGVLVRPEECEVCRASARIIVGHHEDYSLPLEVDWMCSSCHKNHHAQKKATA